GVSRRLFTGLQAAQARVRTLLRKRVWKQDVGYWLVGLLVLAIAIPLTPYLDTTLGLDRLRDRIFQTMSESTGRALEPRYVKVVMLGDNEHWKMFKGQPIARDYLADLLTALDKANSAIIALDVDETLYDPQQRVAPGDFDKVDNRAATDRFMRTIAD